MKCLVGCILLLTTPWGGGYLIKFVGSRVRHTTTKLDPIRSKFLLKWGVNRSKINEKGSQLVRKLRRNLIQNAKKKLLNNTFWWKFRPTLGPSISETKCERDKPIFLQKEGVNQITRRHEMGSQSDRRSQKQGSSLLNLHTMAKYGEYLPWEFLVWTRDLISCSEMLLVVCSCLHVKCSGYCW